MQEFVKLHPYADLFEESAAGTAAGTRGWLWRQKSTLVCVQRSASAGLACQLPEKTPACSDQEIPKSTASFFSNSVNLFSPREHGNFLFDAPTRASVTLLKKILQICFVAAHVAKECAASRCQKEMQVAV